MTNKIITLPVSDAKLRRGQALAVLSPIQNDGGAKAVSKTYQQTTANAPVSSLLPVIDPDEAGVEAGSTRLESVETQNRSDTVGQTAVDTRAPTIAILSVGNVEVGR